MPLYKHRTVHLRGCACSKIGMRPDVIVLGYPLLCIFSAGIPSAPAFTLGGGGEVSMHANARASPAPSNLKPDDRVDQLAHMGSRVVWEAFDARPVPQGVVPGVAKEDEHSAVLAP